MAGFGILAILAATILPWNDAQAKGKDMTPLLLVLMVAAQPGFTVGESLSHNLSVCVEKADAIEIVEAAKVSHEAAVAKWNSKDMCQSVPVVGPKVGAVIHSAEVKRDGKPVTLRVVEITHEGKVVGYFMTSDSVSPAKSTLRGEPGTERNS